MGKNESIVKVKNATGEIITDIHFMHRYDSDVFNPGSLAILAKDATETIGKATYWTGFMRTGYDYWWIQFIRDGAVYTCKADFYCYLTADDAASNEPVILEVQKDQMNVLPPKSSSCSVKIYPEYGLLQEITEDHVASGAQVGDPVEEAAKKCPCF